jgi:RNA recognition motif-containing protein
MGARLYVGNLPFDADEAALRKLFESGGRSVTDVKLVTDRTTGQPRGFGFVEMATEAEAQAAISELNGAEFGGRSLRVDIAAERQDSDRGSRGPGGPRGGRPGGGPGGPGGGPGGPGRGGGGRGGRPR